MANPRRAMAPRRATAQRATPRRLRRLLIVAVAVVVVLGAAAVYLLRPGGPGIPSAAGQSPEAAPSTAESSKEASTPAADAALDRCINESKAADAVLLAADAGVKDWHDHVQAQTDGNSGKISVSEMNAIFQRTRLAGPAELAKYDSAVTDLQQLGGACDPMSGAKGRTAKHLDACLDRRKVQDTAMKAAAGAMTDWRDHQTKEGGTDAGHYGESTRHWLADWRNAPEHIDAYQKEQKLVAKAPACADV